MIKNFFAKLYVNRLTYWVMSVNMWAVLTRFHERGYTVNAYMTHMHAQMRAKSRKEEESAYQPMQIVQEGSLCRSQEEDRD